MIRRLDLKNYQVGVPWREEGDRLSTVVRFCRRAGPVDKLLDIGCGDGGITMLLTEATGAREVFGVEVAPEAVGLAAERGVRCSRVDLDAADLPFEADGFDLVYCGELIEHLFDPDHLLDEIHRVLKPGGRAVLTTPNLASWYNRIMLLMGYQPYRTSASLRWGDVGKLRPSSVDQHQPDHIRVMTWRAFRDLLHRHGFRIRGARGYHLAGHLHRSALVRLVRVPERLLGRFPSLASGVVVAVEKEDTP